MNPERLLQNFDRLIDTPDAVPRLRRFILDLAVRGKLVEQDPEDEPAEELLKRIEGERARLVKEGKIKLSTPLLSTGKDHFDFTIPTGWGCARLGDISVCLDFKRIPINSAERLQRICGKKTNELFPYYGATQQQGWIDDYLFDEEILLLGEDGVPFLDPLRSKAFIVSGKSWVNNHAHVFRGIFTSNSFLMHWLNVFDYTGLIAGATRAKLNQSKAIAIPVPIPPLVEQQRIVAKVDELMNLCDELEAAQAKRERRRDRLVAATLHGLNNGKVDNENGDSFNFEDSARFYFNHLPRLTTRAEHIQQLRQTILNLAVRGKLVKQNPEDEPATELIERNRVAKKRLSAEQQMKRHEICSDMTKDENPFAIPVNWKWVHFGEIAFILSGHNFDSADFKKNKGIKVIKITNAGVGQFVETDECLPNAFCMSHKNFVVFKGDLIMALTRPYIGNGLKISVCPDSYDGSMLNQRVAAIRMGELADRSYAYTVLRSSFVLSSYKKRFEGRGLQPNLKVGDVSGLQFPLPPLAEQHRIVAKVDELMALCDEMEGRITTTTTTSRKLLEATLQEALADYIQAA